jgi:hypothetical protein
MREDLQATFGGAHRTFKPANHYREVSGRLDAVRSSVKALSLFFDPLGIWLGP